MKNIFLFVFFACFFISSTINAHDLFAFNAENLKYETQHGMLNGAFTQQYPNGKLMVEGQFENNQRIGTWNFYNYQGNLIEKRLYFNNLSYAIMRNGKKIFKELNANGQWDPIRSRDVKFQKRYWKVVKKDNGGFLDIDRLVGTVNKKEGGEFYADERFVNQIDRSLLENIVSLKVKEDVIYDNQREALYTRTLGIGFVNDHDETVAWIYYADWKKDLRKVYSTWRNDDINLLTLEDVFSQKAYRSAPYKYADEQSNNKSMVELELELIHMENVFIIAKA